jgi:hypothetical protein
LPNDDNEYDEYYFQDIEKTAKIIFHALLSSPDESEFYYYGSW